jgi:hypothetical protein
MKKITLLTLYCLLFSVYSTFAQVPADSLTGTYAGIFKEKKSTDATWAINLDTLRVESIDSTTCKIIQMYATYYYWIPTVPFTFYTAYTYCDSTPTNYYYKFYGGDSVCFIDNNIPQPPPNTYTISYQFYGKRIKKIVTGIEQLTDNEKQIVVYPNLTNGKFTVYLPDDRRQLANTEIVIFNILGKKVFTITNEKIQTSIEIDISPQPKGIYFIQVKTWQGIVTKKIIIN